MGTGVIFPKHDNRRDYPLTRGPHEFIEDQVERTPDAPALTMGPERISYRELNSRSNRLAHFLREQGVGAESLVGVCLDRSFDSVVSLLAILKSGGTYLPLDPKFPQDRLEFMLADSEVSLRSIAFVPAQKSAGDNGPSCSARPGKRVTLQGSGDEPLVERQPRTSRLPYLHVGLHGKA